MNYDSTVKIPSTVVPGLQFIINVLTDMQRLELNMKLAEARQEQNMVTLDHRMLVEEGSEIIQPIDPVMAADLTKPTEEERAEAERRSKEWEVEYKKLSREERRRWQEIQIKLTDLSERFEGISKTKIIPEWVRAGLVDLFIEAENGNEQYNINGSKWNIEVLILAGPRDLLTEIYGQIYQRAFLTPDATKN